MHVDCFQIYDTEYYKPEECEAYSANDMYEALKEHVDYVSKFNNQAEAIRLWLTTLSDCGCSVDYEKQTFTVKDKAAFAEFLFGWSEEYNGKLNELDLLNFKDLGDLVCKCMSKIYRRFPTVMDFGVGYGSLYEALMYDLFSPWNTGKEKTYKLVAVADCHF